MSIRERDQEAARPAPRPASPAPAEEPRRTGPLGRVQALLDGVRAEVRKVTWPSRAEARNLTIVVIGISVFVGGLLGIVDLLLVGAVRLLASLTGNGGF